MGNGPHLFAKDCVFAFLIYDNNIILQKRDDKPTIASPNRLAGFGGAIDSNESPDDAIRREIQEETSLDIEILEFVNIGELEIGVNGAKAKRFVYICSGLPNTNFQVYEGQGAENYTLDQLLKMKEDDFAPSTYKAINTFRSQLRKATS